MKRFYIINKAALEGVTVVEGTVKDARAKALEACSDGEWIVAECTGPVTISTESQPVRRMELNLRKRNRKA